MQLQVTEVFDFIHRNYIASFENYDKVGFVLEGSSGSSKTHSIIQFLQTYDSSVKDAKITCGRAKMTWTIPSIWEDFKNLSSSYNLGYGFNKSEHTATTLNNNKFRFVGADDPQKFHGPRQDVFWFNEAMELAQASFNQVNMRTNKLWFLDYNPSFEKHWIFDTLLKNMQICKDGVGMYKVMRTWSEEEQRDITTIVFYLHSTFRMNAFLPAGQRQVILGYEETPENIQNGTADEWHWNVYGLGKRAAPKGLVFKHWWTYDDLPDGNYYRVFGVDWGGNDPTTLIECNFDRSQMRVFVKEHVYNPEISMGDLVKKIKELNQTNDEVICDSSRRDSIRELQNNGINAIPSNKGSNTSDGFIIESLDRLKEFKIFVHDESLNFKTEIAQYKYVINQQTGEAMNKAEDTNNHGIDPLRYCTRYYMEMFGIQYRK